MCKNSTIDYEVQRQRINEIVKKFKKEVGLDPILDWDNDSFLTHLEALYTQTDIQNEIAKIPHFDEEDISIAKTRLDERFAILQERALSIRKDRDDWLSELAKLGEFDR